MKLVRGERVEGNLLVDGINATIDTYVVSAEWMEQYMSFEDELAAREKAAAKKDALAHVRALMQSQGWGVEAAMDALGLAPEERAYVTKELQGES